MQTLCFKTTLNPTAQQVQALTSHVGAVRFAYNWSISHVVQNWQQVQENPALAYVRNDGYGLRKALNEVKNEAAPWWKENSRDAFSTGCAHAGIAFKNWFKGHKGSKRVGFPQYKKRSSNAQIGIVFSADPKRLELGERKFILPRIGAVRLYERLKTVRVLLNQGGSIGNVTVSTVQNRWWIAINVRVDDDVALRYFQQRHTRKGSARVGLDVGIKVFLTSSDGTVVQNPAFLRKSLAKLRKANKRLSRRQSLNKKTDERASARWEKSRVQVVKAHAKIANQRRDFLHKLTTNTVLQNALIGIEDLNIKGLAKNRHLSLSISDAGWGEFKRQIHYKSKWYGAKVVEVNRFYPSSKTCSDCGTVKAKLFLSERKYKCEKCGLSLDRDLNAALNIKKEAIRLDELQVAQSCGETLNGRGGKSSGLVLAQGETFTYEASSRTSVLQPASQVTQGEQSTGCMP